MVDHKKVVKDLVYEQMRRNAAQTIMTGDEVPPLHLTFKQIMSE